MLMVSSHYAVKEKLLESPLKAWWYADEMFDGRKV